MYVDVYGFLIKSFNSDFEMQLWVHYLNTIKTTIKPCRDGEIGFPQELRQR